MSTGRTVSGASLAIAADGFGAPSETFVRDHVRMIVPGRTVLLARNGDGAAQLGCPVFVTGRSPASSLPGRLLAQASRMSGLGRYWHPRPLTRADTGRAAAFLEDHRARALLAEFGPIGAEFAPAAAAAGVPLFVHFHGFDASALLRYPAVVAQYRALFGQAAGIVAPSRFVTDRLAEIGCPAHKLHVNACGVDPGRMAACDPVPGRVLSVGRLVEKKAPHLTLTAFARVAEDLPEARLEVIGSGPLEARCRRLVGALGLGDRVRFHGRLDHAQVLARMGRCALFAQHSVTAANGDVEGMPVAILEAMAAGLPVVATRHSGIPEAVVHGVTGLLVEERDVDGMAEAMRTLLRDPARSAAMGRAGRARVLERFTLQRSTGRLREIMGLEGLAEPDPADGKPS